jgi:hypothetical protein
MLIVIVLSVSLKYLHAECRYTECRYAECRGAGEKSGKCLSFSFLPPKLLQGVNGVKLLFLHSGKLR